VHRSVGFMKKNSAEDQVVINIDPPLKCNYQASSGKNCERPAIGIERDSNKSYCIFHMPCSHPQKIKEDFIKALKNDFAHKPIWDWNMEGFYFPSISYKDGEFPDPGHIYSVNLSNATFQGDTDLSQCNFGHRVSFRNTIFEGNLIAKSCIFGGKLPNPHSPVFGSYPIDFEGAHFKGSVLFEGTEFYGSTSFTNTHFFAGVRFLGETMFHETLLFEEVNAENETCFRGVKFHKKVSFNGSHLTCTSFSDAQFHEKTMFTGVEFQSADDATFFTSTVFMSEVSFYSAKFLSPTFFNGAIFQAQVDFSNGSFKSSTEFKGCTFSGANFECCSFDSVDWRDSECSGVLALHNIRPSGDSIKIENLRTKSGVAITVSSNLFPKTRNVQIRVVKCTIAGPFTCKPGSASVHLNNSTFLSDVRIDPSLNPDFDFDDWTKKLPKWHLFADLCHFCSAATFAYPAITSLQDCRIDTELLLLSPDMKGAFLKNTNIPAIRFDDAIWLEIDRSTFGFGKLAHSKALVTEYKLGGKRKLLSSRHRTNLKKILRDKKLTKEEVHSLVLQYRGISQSYQIRQDFESAAAFKIADQDIRRQCKHNSSAMERLALVIYRNIAAYGESIALPMFWLFIITLIFTYLNLFAGIPVLPENGSILQYSFSTPNESALKMLMDFIISFGFTFTNCIPSISTPIASPNYWLRLFLFVQRAASLVSIAALVFAVRRKLIR